MNAKKKISTPVPGFTDNVEVTNLDHFVALLTAWHTKKVKVLQHMVQIPPGTEMETPDGKKTIMEGDFLDGFKAGLALALMELGNLPFAAQTNDEPNTH